MCKVGGVRGVGGGWERQVGRLGSMRDLRQCEVGPTRPDL